MLRVLITLFLLSAVSTGKGFEILVADARRDSLYLLTDVDESGVIESDEAVAVYADEATGPDLSTPADLCLAEGTVFLLDGGTLDTIFALADSDGDGLYFGDGEILSAYDSSCMGPRLRTPNRLEYRDEVFAVVDDSRVKAQVVLFQDLDGDGKFCEGGESLIFYDQTVANVEDAPRDPEALCILPEGGVLVADGTTGSIYLFRDSNGDGTATEEGEITVFYEPQGTEEPPRFSSLVLYGRGLLAADRNGGTILYLEDRDGDGRVQAEEAAVFCGEGPSVPFIAEPLDMWVDDEGGVWLVDNGTDQVYFLNDRNSDGDALDPGEALVVLSDSSVLSQPTSLLPLKGVSGPTPRIDSISPSSGKTLGGQEVLISGGDFRPGTAVFFGLTPALSVEYVDSETLRVTSPPGSGTVDVTVASVTGLDVAAGAWNYEGGGLSVSGIEPESGPSQGGFEVTFHGEGLESAEVWFDGLPAEIVSREETVLVVTAPSHQPGEITVLVTDGSTEVVLRFTYTGAELFIRGDTDGDGEVAINDAVVILSILFAGRQYPQCQDRCDVNDDGSVNIADAIRLLGYLFGGNEEPPEPFPDPGDDPTSDSLSC